MKLGTQEAKVLTLIAEGNTRAEIADYLNISPNTVKSHLAHVFEKFNAINIAHAVAIGITTEEIRVHGA